MTRKPSAKTNRSTKFEQQCIQIHTKQHTTKNHERRGLEANRSVSRKKLQAEKGLGPVGPYAWNPSVLVSKGRANVSYSNQPHGKAAVGIETNLVSSDIYQSLDMDPPTFVSTFLAAKWSFTLCITIGWIMLDRYCRLNVKTYNSL